MSGIEGVMAEINSPRPGGKTPAAVPLTSAEEQYPLQPSELDPTVYTDPVQVEREMSLIFQRSWLPIRPERNDRDWNHFMKVTFEDAGVVNRISTMSRSLGLRKPMFSAAESRLTAFHREVLRIVGGSDKLKGGAPKSA